MNDLTKIPCMLFRGGTSKGVCLLADDLPADDQKRNQLILRIMGSPDHRQIDGIGGGSFTTSKVAIISKSTKEGADVDYKFLQVGTDKAIIDDKPTCGNVLTAVGVFALENNLVVIKEGTTKVRIFDINTKSKITQVIQTPNKVIQYQGDFSIAGVPGSASAIDMSFDNIAGGKTGHYLPTSNVIDVFNGIHATCVDVSMPTVFIKAQDLGCTGLEDVSELDSNKALIESLDSIRELASQKMGLGNSKGSVIPKIALISKPNVNGADINIRYFTPLSCHPAIAVSASFCLSVGCFIEGTLMHQMTKCKLSPNQNHEVSIQNPSGVTKVTINFPDDDIFHVKAYIKRTARIIFSGSIYA